MCYFTQIVLKYEKVQYNQTFNIIKASFNIREGFKQIRKLLYLLQQKNQILQKSISQQKIKMENRSAEKTQINSLLFKHTQSQYQSSPHQLIFIKNQLENKYLLHFNFFLSKPVNQIIYELTNRPVTQAFLDARLIAQQGECMKRSYHYNNQEGNDEIFDRIKMLGQFYNMNQKYLKYEYPMMIITNTKSIFQKRQRRLKKIQAGEGSSDQTQQKSSFFNYSFDTQHFLKDLSNVSKIYKDDKNDKNQQSFDSDVHDVYLKVQDPSIKLLNIFQSKELQEVKPHKQFLQTNNGINHLIFDFLEQQSIESTKQRKNNSQQRQSLIKIINRRDRISNRYLIDSNNQSLQKKVQNLSKKMQQNISRKKQLNLSKKMEENNSISKFKKPNFLSSYLNMFQNKYRKICLEGDRSDFGNTDLKTTTDENDTNEKIQIKKIDAWIQKQKQQKLKNRKKIRQKAQELLRQVRMNSQIQ